MAQEGASNGFYDFMYSKYLLNDLFDIRLHEDDYVERAYNIFRDIGNIATAVHAFEFAVDNSRKVILPCNVEFIEAVSTGTDWSEVSDQNVILWHSERTINPNNFLPDVINNPSVNKILLNDKHSNLHPKGEFMTYELQGTVGHYKLFFPEHYIGSRGVCIYRGMCVDDDGNPLITRKEAEAIAYKLAFLDTQKRFFMGDPRASGQLEYIKMESGRKMAAAKIPEYITQNEFDRMLSAMTRHDRKVFWSSYKPIQ